MSSKILESSWGQRIINGVRKAIGVYACGVIGILLLVYLYDKFILGYYYLDFKILFIGMIIPAVIFMIFFIAYWSNVSVILTESDIKIKRGSKIIYEYQAGQIFSARVENITIHHIITIGANRKLLIYSPGSKKVKTIGLYGFTEETFNEFMSILYQSGLVVERN